MEFTLSTLMILLTITTAFLSIILASLKISEFHKNRPILKMTFKYPGIIFERGQPKEKCFLLIVSNIGQRPILIQQFFGITKIGEHFIITSDSDPSFEYPKSLKETETLFLKADIDKLKDENLKQLGIYDGSGKKWKLNRKQIKEINRKSAELRENL